MTRSAQAKAAALGKVCFSKTRVCCRMYLPLDKFSVSGGIILAICKDCYCKEAKMRRSTMANIDWAGLIAAIEYDPETGILTKKGKIQTSKGTHGYIRVSWMYRKIDAHRVIWYYMTGQLPAKHEQIDHINHIRDDNRWNNLRIAERVANLRNQSQSKSNVSGQTGVRWHEPLGKWHARIKVDYITHHLGYFESFEDAVAARKQAEKFYGFHENHGKVKRR